MKRWDGLKVRFMDVYESRDLAPSTVLAMSREWDEWGCYLKNRRPRPKLGDVTAGMITDYIGRRCKFHAPATQQGVMSRMRVIGEFLVDVIVFHLP